MRNENPRGGIEVWRRHDDSGYPPARIISASVWAIPNGRPPAIIIERFTISPLGTPIGPERIEIAMADWRAIHDAVCQEVERYASHAQASTAHSSETR